jgi:hypothetical protein
MSVVLVDWLWLVAVELVLVLALVLAVGAAHLRDLSLKPSTVKDARGSNNDMSPKLGKRWTINRPSDDRWSRRAIRFQL